MGSLHTADYAVMAIYLLAVIGIGLGLRRGGQDTETYLLGGRRMAWWLSGVSYVVALLSTITMVGVPGYAYAHGLTMAISTLLIPPCAVAAFHIFVPFYFRGQIFTPFHYLEQRFSPAVRGLAAGFFLVARTIYIGLVLYASAMLFAAVDQWSVPGTILLIGVVGMLYMVLGGLQAVVWSDLLHFVVLVGGVVVILVKAIAAVPGGIPGTLNYAFANGRGLPHLTEASFYGFDPTVQITLWGIFLAVLNEQLFFNSSDQIALQKLLSTSSYQQARRTLYTSVLLLVPVLGLLWLLGLAIFAFYGQLPLEQRPRAGDEALFHFLAKEVPAPMPGLVLSAMLAAILSTLDAGINSLATVATKDFYVRLFRPQASEAQQVAFSRCVCVTVGILAMVLGFALARTSESVGATVMETTMAWLTMSVALPPVFLLGMLSRRARSVHALVQLLVGWLVTAAMLAWYLASQNNGQGEVSFLVVGIPGPLLALFIGFLLSRCAPRLPDSALRNLTFWTLER